MGIICGSCFVVDGVGIIVGGAGAVVCHDRPETVVLVFLPFETASYFLQPLLSSAEQRQAAIERQSSDYAHTSQQTHIEVNKGIMMGGGVVSMFGTK